MHGVRNIKVNGNDYILLSVMAPFKHSLHQVQVFTIVPLCSLNLLNNWTKKRPVSHERISWMLLQIGSRQLVSSLTWKRLIEQLGNMASFETSPGLASEVDCMLFVSEYLGNRRIRVRIGNIIGHTKATKAHILSRRPMTACSSHASFSGYYFGYWRQ